MRERDAVLIESAADFRRRLTDAEVRLWTRLKNRQLAGAKFSRQIAIAGYICDFVCRQHRLIVKVDGSQHFENEYDRIRDRRLQVQGYRVLRFWNAEVLESEESLEHILHRIALTISAGSKLPDPPYPTPDAHPLPLPVGEGSHKR